MAASSRYLPLLVTSFVLLAATGAHGDTLTGFATMGASETQGKTYDDSWVPYEQNLRGLNFGGVGYPYNVAIGGATSETLLEQNQHTQVASFVQSGQVDMAFLSIGGNDFSAVSGQIATGALNGAALTAWAQGVVDNIDTAIDTVLAQHPTGMVIAGMPDVPLTPAGQVGFDSPTKIARGENAVNLVNTLLKQEVLSRGLVFVDLAQAMRDLTSQPLVVGGVTIDMSILTPTTPRTSSRMASTRPRSATGCSRIRSSKRSTSATARITNYSAIKRFSPPRESARCTPARPRTSLMRASFTPPRRSPAHSSSLAAVRSLRSCCVADFVAASPEQRRSPRRGVGRSLMGFGRLRREAAAHGVLCHRARHNELQQVVDAARLAADA